MAKVPMMFEKTTTDKPGSRGVPPAKGSIGGRIPHRDKIHGKKGK